jgi:hypothetical protein
VKNPMWFVERNLERVNKGRRALERRLVGPAGSLTATVGIDMKFAADILRQVIHRLMVAMIELGVLSLVGQLMPARSPARVYPLRVD